MILLYGVLCWCYRAFFMTETVKSSSVKCAATRWRCLAKAEMALEEGPDSKTFSIHSTLRTSLMQAQPLTGMDFNNRDLQMNE